MSRDLASSASEAQPSNAGRVLVVGAGVAGIRSAIGLAEVGCRVTLLDASRAIGGILQKLDHQFPNNHCGMCRMLPEVGRIQSSRFCLRKGLFHDGIDIFPNSTVQEVRGEPGSFEVEVLRQARWIDTERCAGCPAPCVEVCPVEVPDAFNHGLTRRKAIYRPVPQSLPDSLCIDRQACSRCGDCVVACPENAISLDTPDERTTVQADAVILAVGTSLHRPDEDPTAKHLQVSPNVVTALQFERMLGLAGPRRDSLSRPSDGKPVERVAWLQCVGSRDRKHGRDVCSTVCCMFALKEAMLVRDIDDGAIGATIFYMDIRGQGRDFHRNRELAEQRGVALIRSRVHDIEPAADGGVSIRYFDQASGTMKRGHYDLLVLSTGQSPSAAIATLGEQFGWTPSEGGYAPTMAHDQVRSTTPGVFLAGSITGPTDIAESITGAIAAAGEACKLLTSLGRSVGIQRTIPEPKKVDGDESRVLVLRCGCHHDRTDGVAAIPDSDHGPGADVHVVESPCLPEGARRAAEILAATNHDRVVFAACHTHGYRRKLTGLAERAGFDAELIRVVDARSATPGSAKTRIEQSGGRGGSVTRPQSSCDTERAGLPTHSCEGQNSRPVRMAVAALRSVHSQRRRPPTLSAEPRVLVVGGGLAGMRAALSLANRDIDVHLVERSDHLGGRFADHCGSGFDGSDLHAHVSRLQAQVLENAHITVHVGARVLASQSAVGRRDTIVRKSSGDTMVSHGATILATGGHEAGTESYGYGTSERIVTQSELERQLDTGSLEPHALGLVVMIQCVDSREPGSHDYCSRICCARALRNAKRIRGLNPRTRVFILYRDMMTCGLWERDFTEARREGVLFAAYDVGDKPRVQVLNHRPSVTVTDPILGRPLQLEADWLVLSNAVESDASNVELARIFGVDLDEHGFFREADAKWRPVDFLADGVFVAGTAHAPQPARQVVMEAEAAAHRAFERLTRTVPAYSHGIAELHHALCARCGLCIEACPYHARRLDEDEHQIVVDPLGCRGCGVCTSTCPNGATRLGAMGERQMMEALDAALEDVVVKEGVSS